MMDASDIREYSLVECRIVGHQHYGLVVRTLVGDIPGYVDESAISDEPFAARDGWPRSGRQLMCVVLGHASGGRLRLSSRPRDIEFACSVADVAAALTEWRLVRDDGGRLAGFFQSANAAPTLRWALRRPADSLDHARASEIITEAPAAVKSVLREMGLLPPE